MHLDYLPPPDLLLALRKEYNRICLAITRHKRDVEIAKGIKENIVLSDTPGPLIPPRLEDAKLRFDAPDPAKGTACLCMWWGDRDGRWEPLPKIGKDGDLAIRNALDWTKDNQDIIAAIILKNAAHVLSAYAHNPSWNHPDIIEEQYRSLEALDKHRPETPKMNELCYKHPKLLRAKGVSRRVLAKLYSAPGESFSVLELAGSRHGGARGRAKAACLALEKVGLAKRDGDRWTLGDAARF